MKLLSGRFGSTTTRTSLGKLVIVLKRHEEQVANLYEQDWQELHVHVQRTTERLLQSLRT